MYTPDIPKMLVSNILAFTYFGCRFSADPSKVNKFNIELSTAGRSAMISFQVYRQMALNV